MGVAVCMEGGMIKVEKSHNDSDIIYKEHKYSNYKNDENDKKLRSDIKCIKAQ